MDDHILYYISNNHRMHVRSDDVGGQMPDFFTKDDVRINDEVQFVPLHKVVLTFDRDTQAEAFIDWWEETGMQNFGEWTIDNGENYEG